MLDHSLPVRTIPDFERQTLHTRSDPSRSATLPGVVATTWIALGANIPGAWGIPRQTLESALARLSDQGIEILAIGPMLMTDPLPGGGRQPRYLNTVVAARCRRPAREIIIYFKYLEALAGRRTTRRMGARPLDIDLIAHGVTRYQWPARRAGTITLPHPELHRRAFVLTPLAALAPAWVHPCLGRTARQLATATNRPRRRI